jgi:uncharacterized repeat protein (TIGR01451 family)
MLIPKSLRDTRPNRTRKQAAHLERKPSARRSSLRVELLEDRTTPTVNPATPLELDGNVTTTTSHDWDQIFADAQPLTNGDGSFTQGPTSNALAGSFFTDAVNSNTDDIFQGGGSKDTLGIQAGKWLYTGSKPQGKDDITHAYASAYIDSNSHLILYAAMDRFDNSGDSTAGFWFFANNIGQNPNVTQNGGHPFTGTHQDGDILLVSDFTVGGSTSTIKVFRWTGNDATGSLVPLNNGNPINGNTYATVNSAAISVPWSYTNKSGQHQPAAGEFLEEGVDLTALGLQGCFSSFLAETRSSQSPTATLSDFVIGSFPLCSLAAPQFTGLSKFDTFTNQGDFVTYPLTVQNTGGMPLFIQSVTDTLLGNVVVNHTLQQPSAVGVTSITSNFDFSQPLAPGASLTILVTRQVQQTDPDPTNNTVTFVGTDDLAGTADPIRTSVSDSVNLFQPSATMTLTASPSAGVVGTPITYTYTVNNTSSTDSPNLILDGSANNFLTDSLFGNLEADAIAAGGGSLAPGASFSFAETRALQAGDPSPLTDAAAAGFTLFQSALFSGSNVIHAQASTSTRIVDAQISIAPNATNEVGQPHTFTVTVLQDDGLPAGAAGGDAFTGFGPASGASVNVSLANTNGANAVASTLLSGTTNSSGQFQVTFTSATAGQVIGNATATLSVGGVSLTRATGDGLSGDSGPATKTFVDAKISIAPNATNGITEPHTFTATVLQDDGLTADQGGDNVTGFGPAAGASITVALTNTGGAVAIPSTPLSGTTDANGQFSVTFTSDSAGQVTGSATATPSVGGVALTRATGDSHTGDGSPATKTFVAGSLRWKKVDEAGNLLGGATFLVTATGGTAASAGHTPLSVSVLDNGPFDADPTPGQILLNSFQSFAGSPLGGLAMGTYTVQETVPPQGYTLDPKVLSATLTLTSPNADLSGTPFVDTLPHLSITKTVTGGGTSAVIHPGDTASFTITVTNDGAGTALNVTVTDQLPDATQLSWSITSSTFDTTSLSATDFLTATKAALPGGATVTVVVSAVVPLDFFGNEGNGVGNGDALPLSLFELDGNATTGVLGTSGSTTTSHDWDQVFADNSANPPTNTAGAIASSFATDPVNTNSDNIYTGGGSKDTLGIQQGQWLFKGGKPQSKDDITHAYAALYKDPVTDDQILYAGLDRFDNSGDSTAGFWFFVNPIGQNPNVNQNGGHPFTGTHTTGDILLVSDFTVGGSVSTIRVFEWVGNDATGSLVPLNNGNPIGGSTFAIVNGSAISVPWSFTNKSGQHQPAAGEFLEEGINLTALGLNGCFSSFLAETRSSQSPTATLSDLVIGSFQTCVVQLPNIASVQADNFNNGVPITSNEAIITINDGHAMEATSLGNGAGGASLTVQQVQPVVDQAIAAWRAAGVAPATLTNLGNLAVHVDNLPRAELGYFSPGAIWIDATAAGWGWSTTGDPGRMDLRTVITHELGHALGFEHSDAGAMEPTLAPGVQLVPEAPGGSDTVVAAASSADSGTGAGAPAGAVAVPTLSHTATTDAAVSGVPDGPALPVAAPPAFGPQAPAALFAPTVVLAVAPVGPDTSWIALVPGLWPPVLGGEGGRSAAPLMGDEARDAAAAGWPAPLVDSADAGLDADVTDPIVVG